MSDYVALKRSCHRYDVGAGEWETSCPCCRLVWYTPNLKECLRQFLKHTREVCLSGY